MLIAEDGLMLSPMVRKQTLNIADSGAEFHIYKKYNDFQHALRDVANEIVKGKGFYKADDKGGQKNKQQQGQSNAQHNGGADYQLLGFLSGEVLTYPFVQLVRFLLLLLRNETGGVGEGLHALVHGIQKNGTAPYKGPAENGVLILVQLYIFNFFHKPVFGTADDGLLFRAAHQNALYKGLTTDGSAETAALILLCHNFSLG